MQNEEEMFIEQIELEKRMVSNGADAYLQEVRLAEQEERGGDTGYAAKLMREYLPLIAEAIRIECLKKKPGRGNKALKLLREINPHTAGFIGLKCLFNTFNKPTKLARICTKLGTLIEDELRFQKFYAECPDYFDAIIADFKRKGTSNYQTIHRVFTNHAAAKGITWEFWGADECALVGSKVLDAILLCTDICTRQLIKTRHSQVWYIVPKQETLDWINKYNSVNSLLHPDKMPCVYPPDPWVLANQGGYYTPRMRLTHPLVLTKNKLTLDRLRNPSPTVLSAINTLQETAWEVNKPMLAFLKEAWSVSAEIGLPRSTPTEQPACPVPETLRSEDMTPEQRKNLKDWKFAVTQLHSADKERLSKCFEVVRCMQMATTYSKYSKFWFVWHCDFRGRMYPITSGISPQGADFNKALLRFHEGKPLGESGEMWFWLTGANLYGIDKVPLKERVLWVQKNSERIIKFAENPFNDRDFWMSADKPWQFLAWALEYKEYKKVGASFVSHLPMPLDGTCNGIQNFSAMLRDPIGGKVVNLIPGDTPLDVYQEVANVLTDMVVAQTDPKYQWWKDYLSTHGGKFNRKLTKRQVMTLPYGVTQNSCRDYTVIYLKDAHGEAIPRAVLWQQASILTPLLWHSMGSVVVAAREAMDWIQECAVLTAKSNKPVSWYSPAGFPVVQDRRRTVSKRVSTKVYGKLDLVVQFATADTDLRKQKLACAPNFVHSMDAAHAMLTINAAKADGCSSFAFIHDDFGVHAADTEKFFQIIREEFVHMYSTCEPLLEFKNCVQLDTGVQLPEPPNKGNLDITQVLDSTYFFS